MKLLVINPGGSSTKIAVFEDETEQFSRNIAHTGEELRPYPRIFDQFDFRRQLILDELKAGEYTPASFDAVVGRGGLMKEIEGGVYRVNDGMISDLKAAVRGEHAANLGSALARSIGDETGAPSFVVDPVSVDEFQEISRVTGIRDLKYSSWLHSLNHKAVARKTAADMGGKYEEFNFIIAHLGSGISIVPHCRGRMIDGSGGRTNGPFSSDRSGGLPAYPLIELCYSGKYTREELVDKVSSFGGFYDYLGTKDLVEVERRIAGGDSEAKLIMDAFIYQIAKEIASYGAALYGKVDRIVLTGGIAHSALVTGEVEKRVRYLAPVSVVAGEMEMEAMALGALRVLRGEEEVKEYE
ncbi:butyrate kinase [Bacilliculturomica massiliensis]|uniref:butyrate kinase n=1 Tax=Bacilliculturomica massiliensis TaxID=1917867 RepID=UPI0010307B65|nr:butyrate kinase [Bacilliculturomica massiliensis]